MVLLRRWSLLCAFAVGALAVGSIPATGAAPTAKERTFHDASYVPLLNSGKPRPVPLDMDYNGGPVMPSNTDYMVLWSPGGAAAYPSGFVAGISQWFTDLAHDSGGHNNSDSVSAQYQDLTGAFASYNTTFGGVLVDTNPYPANQCPTDGKKVTNCLIDSQLQTEVQSFVGSTGHRADLSHEYFVMTPPHVEFCFSNDPTAAFGGCSAGALQDQFFCAYHENTTSEPFVIYANDPYVVGNRGCDDGNHPNSAAFDGELSGGLSHEQNESVSDPIPNDAWTNGIGPAQGSEIGDECQGSFGTTLGIAPDGAKFNQVINGHPYWYQGEYSNIGHQCLTRLGPLGTMPTAAFVVRAQQGLTMHFDAQASSAPGGVAQYVWQFNDAFAAQTIVRPTPEIEHTFPSAGAFSVGLTVIGPDGSSTGAGAIVVTGQSGSSAGFNSSSSGRTVSFNALFTTMSAQPVTVNFWDFGDGSVGRGFNPTHTYSKAGTYTVELVQFSGVGSAFPGNGAGPIVTQTITVT